MSVRVEAPVVAGAEERTVAVWQGRVRMRVVSKGRGPALVFFHGPWGLTWDPFLDQLAESFTVYAPEHPGTTPEAHDDVYHLDGLWDLVLCYDELLETLGIRNAAFVGHSFGGMTSTMSRIGMSVVCGPCQLPQQRWNRMRSSGSLRIA